METIIDDIDDRTEVFEITDTPPKNIISFDDLMNHIEYQFIHLSTRQPVNCKINAC